MKFETEYRITKTGLRVGFRSACADDAQLEIDYLKRVCGETPFLLSEAEDVAYTLEDETEYLTGCENSAGSLMLNAYVDGDLVGNGSFTPVGSAKRLAHRASLGIAIFKEYCDQGIGEILIGFLLEKARECGYEIMELDVFSKNVRGIHLYKKLGFAECGRLRNAIKYKDGTYDDLVLMQKELGI